MKLPIRITVTSLFLMLSILILVIMVYLQSIVGKELAQNTMNDYFKIISHKIEKRIDYENNINNNIIHINQAYLKDITYEDFYKKKQLYLEIFTKQLEKTNRLYSMYIGFNTNQFYEVIKLDSDKNLRKLYNGSQTDQWLLIEIDANFNKKLSLYNKQLIKTATTIQKTDYLPRQRPWYKASLNSDKITKIGPYDFSNIETKGFTYSLHLGNQNIFAIDVLWDNFNEILKSKDIKNSLESFLFTPDSIQSSKILQTQNHIYKEIIQNIQDTHLSQKIQNIKLINGKEYLYNISKIDTPYNTNEYLLSYVLFDEMIAPFMEKSRQITQVVMIIFLLLLPLIWYFASIIVKPILSLVKESKKVENRNFDTIKPVNCFVYEIDLLSKSLGSMATSINTYQTNLEEIVTQRTNELELKNKELEYLSVTDKLTAIYNRIMIDKTMDIQIQKAKTKNHTFGVIIIDIDYFKDVNDTYGHQVGDTTLVHFAKILKENIKDLDLVGRWGGEEFLIITEGSSLSHTLQLAEHLRVLIEQYDFPVLGNKTASFGIAEYCSDDTAESIITRADDALYKAKKHGRNQVKS